MKVNFKKKFTLINTHKQAAHKTCGKFSLNKNYNCHSL